MNLKRELRADRVIARLTGANKEEIIRELVDCLHATGGVSDSDAVLQAVQERERKMTTGMEYGVAIPHGKTDAVDRLHVVVGVKPEGVEFACLDGQAARIFVMTVSPQSHSGPHIQLLAEVSRLLSDPQVRTAVLAAQTSAAVLRALTGA